MRLPVVRLAIAFVGLAVGVYGLASLTGRWLGTPPWSERYTTETEMRDFLIRRGDPLTDESGDGLRLGHRWLVSRRGGEWISAGVVAAGAALVLVGAWARRGAGETVATGMTRGGP